MDRTAVLVSVIQFTLQHSAIQFTPAEQQSVLYCSQYREQHAGQCYTATLQQNSVLAEQCYTVHTTAEQIYRYSTILSTVHQNSCIRTVLYCSHYSRTDLSVQHYYCSHYSRTAVWHSAILLSIYRSLLLSTVHQNSCIRTVLYCSHYSITIGTATTVYSTPEHCLQYSTTTVYSTPEQLY